MTPAEMTFAILANIEKARAVMEDGDIGYVLHTRDHVHFLCQRKDGNGHVGSPFLGDPLADDAAVMTTHTTAVSLQRYWNSFHPNDRFNSVVISLRREALVAYIDVQQRAIDALAQMQEGARL
jgi:hypothetical protein